MHKHSATELRQPAGKQTLQFCIYSVGGTAMLQSHSTTKYFKFCIVKKKACERERIHLMSKRS